MRALRPTRWAPVLGALCCACGSGPIDQVERAAALRDWDSVRRLAPSTGREHLSDGERSRLAWAEAQALDVAGLAERAARLVLTVDPRALRGASRESFHERAALLLSEAGFAQEAFDLARESLEDSACPTHARAELWRLCADVHLALGREAEALDAAHRRLDDAITEGARATARRDLKHVVEDTALAAEKRGEWPLALERWQMLLAMDDNDAARAHVAQARRMIVMEDFARAVEQDDLDAMRAASRELLLWDPSGRDRALVAQRLGDAERAQGRMTEAIACFQESLRMDQDFRPVAAFLGLAACFEAQGREDQAAQALQRACESRQDDWPLAVDAAAAFHARTEGRFLGTARFRLPLTLSRLYHDGYAAYPMRDPTQGETLARQANILGQTVTLLARGVSDAATIPAQGALRLFDREVALDEAQGRWTSLSGRWVSLAAPGEGLRRQSRAVREQNREITLEFLETTLTLVACGPEFEVTPLPSPPNDLAIRREALRVQVITEGSESGLPHAKVTLTSPRFPADLVLRATTDSRGEAYFPPLVLRTPAAIEDPEYQALIEHPGIEARVLSWSELSQALGAANVPLDRDREEPAARDEPLTPAKTALRDKNGRTPAATATVRPLYAFGVPEVRVRDLVGGAPLSGAEVQLRSRHRRFERWDTRLTHDDGRARFERQPLFDPNHLEALRFDVKVDAKGYESFRREAIDWRTVGEALAVSLMPEAAFCTLALTVTDALTAQALPGARVVAASIDLEPAIIRAAVTDHFGSATLVRLPGFQREAARAIAYRLEVSRTGYQTWVRPRWQAEGKPEAALAVALTPGATSGD